jgi:hypothetical protein
MRILVLALLIAVLPVTAKAAAAEHWAAMSKTAMSITGDIVIDGDKVTFAGGKSLMLAPYEMARNGDWGDSGYEIAGDVFKIDPPASLKLKRGRPFCAEPATYLVLWTFGDGELTLNVYSGAAAPLGLPDADSLCATYSYEVR